MRLLLAVLLVCLVVLLAFREPIQTGGLGLGRDNIDPHYEAILEPLPGSRFSNLLVYNVRTGNLHAKNGSFFPNTYAIQLPKNVIHVKQRYSGVDYDIDWGAVIVRNVPPYINEFLKGIKGVTEDQKKALTARIITSDSGTMRYPSMFREFKVNANTFNGTYVRTMLSLNYQGHKVVRRGKTITLQQGDQFKVRRQGRTAKYTISLHRSGRKIMSTKQRKMTWKQFSGLGTKLYPLNVEAGDVAKIFGEYQFGRILERCLNEAVPS